MQEQNEHQKIYLRLSSALRYSTTPTQHSVIISHLLFVLRILLEQRVHLYFIWKRKINNYHHPTIISLSVPLFNKIQILNLRNKELTKMSNQVQNMIYFHQRFALKGIYQTKKQILKMRILIQNFQDQVLIIFRFL